MNKAETLRNAARLQNEQRLLERVATMDEIANAVLSLSKSMASLTEEVRETMSGFSEQLAAARNAAADTTQRFESATREMDQRIASIGQRADRFLSQADTLERNLTESMRRSEDVVTKRARLLGLKMWLWHTATSAIVLLVVWIALWTYLGHATEEELGNAYRAGMRAVIEEMSQNYNITPKTAPRKP